MIRASDVSFPQKEGRSAAEIPPTVTGQSQPGAASSRAEPIRVIPPEAFEDAGRRGNLWLWVRRIAVLAVVAGALAAAAWLLVMPRLRPAPATARANPRGAEASPPQAVDATPGGVAARLFPAEPIGRMVVVTELPQEAWLEVDGEVFASGLGIRFPIRVTGGTTHRVAVHAAGYRSWESEVYVAADSLLRLEVSLDRVAPPPQRPSRTARAQTGTPPVADAAPRAAAAETPQPATTAAQRAAGVDARPSLPPALRDSLVLRIEEGRVLREIGRFFDSAAEFQYVIDRVAAASVRYRGVGALETLRMKADRGLIAVRLECRSQNQPRCP